ncbi:hypothetical protein DYB25_004705 [Aphanomyces astaci]|uniref:PNPLA domain-containing protein n=1 Tax=Aphanomyces astaci TaxID=112090 RepID=A0A397CLS6_APHAT|nr:hypothetical protein DYB25_004705 [Aphanomyces astaci]RHY45864.1 hypothetical protein DYB38_007470 [Aphanomyces astaci]
MDALWTDDAAAATVEDGEKDSLSIRKSMKRKAADVAHVHEDHSMWKYFRGLVPRVFQPLVHATTSAGCLDPMWVCHDAVDDALEVEGTVTNIPRPIARVRNQPSHVRGEPIQIGFGGCGGFYNYLLGVASILQERFDLTDAVFSGASAGCFPALVLAMNKNVSDFFHGANLTLIRDADKKTFMGWRDWIPLTKQHTLMMLEPDTYQKLDKKFYCSITRVPSLENELVTSWTDNEDMVDCMLTSGHVPLYHPEYLRSFRGHKYIDGSVSNNDPMPLGNLAPAHVFHFWKWRQILPHWILVSTNANWANQQFEWGRADAVAHLHEIETVLHYKDDEHDE